MARLRSHVKKVACLEGDWEDWRSESSVQPMLQLVEARHPGFQYVHRRLVTEEELKANLVRIGRFPSFQLVYLTFHGSSGAISVGDSDITLEDLAEMMGGRFEGRVIHFGSCSTLNCSPERIQTFMQRTQVTAITGYDRNVDWIESAAFELLYFSAWNHYINASAFRTRMFKDYEELALRLGFVCYCRE